MKNINLLKDEPKKLFSRYLIPSISATLVTSIYILADTIIIGKGIGSDGIAALNLLLPLFSLFFGTGMLFGIGGAVLMAVANGQGNKKLANAYFTNAIFITTIVVILYFIIGNCFLEKIAYILGSSENSIELVMEYGRYLMIGIPVFVFSSFLQAFVRNDNAPKLAMIAVITGGVSNIILDLIFIYISKIGMKGAAVATVIGSTITVLILITHFLSKKNTMKIISGSIEVSKMKKIFQSGVPSFLIEIANGVIMFLFNLQLLRYMGEIGVVVYSIIANYALIAMSLFNGVAQATQPIMATNFGANKSDRVIMVRKNGIYTGIIIGVALFLIGALFPEIVVNIFINPTKEIVGISIPAIRIYFITFLMTSLNIIYSTYFQSIVKPKESMIICMLRGIILTGILVFVLPIFLGVTGIWIAMPIAEFITLLVSIFLVKKENFNQVSIV